MNINNTFFFLLPLMALIYCNFLTLNSNNKRVIISIFFITLGISLSSLYFIFSQLDQSLVKFSGLLLFVLIIINTILTALLLLNILFKNFQTKTILRNFLISLIIHFNIFIQLSLHFIKLKLKKYILNLQKFISKVSHTNKMVVDEVNKNLSNKFKFSFFLPFILSFVDKQIPEGSEGITEFCFSMFILSVICLLNLINLLGYLIFTNFISNSNKLKNYPNINKIFNYFNKTSLFWVLFETILSILLLLLMCISCLIPLGVIIFN